jgi:glutamate N-acetyltransferase/amino-acid N-acetyltransferase
MTAVSQGSTAFERLSDGSVTSASGFRAGAVAAGIKPSGNLDLGLLVSDRPCVYAGTFTQNAFPAAPVVLSRGRLRAAPRAQAVVFNAGNANACTGERGQADAEEMARLAGEVLGISSDLVLAASTGVIGQFLPMDRVRAGLRQVQLGVDGGHQAARAIMTTDTQVKEVAVSFSNGARIGAMTKGVGMIYPNMATMLAFIATDAALEPGFAQSCLKRVVDQTFNMVTVDGDTSTNDSCFLLANGLAGAVDEAAFEAGLLEVCTDLARKMARDGEGATKLIQVDVTGASSDADARRAARAVVGSSLLKAAVHGQDPDWGRVFAAVGNSGAQVDPFKAALWIGSVQVARDGMATDVPRADAQAAMSGEEVQFRVDLGLGSASARAWGCDLTEGYVIENSAYTT